MKNRSYIGWFELIRGLLMILLGIFTIIKPDGTATKLVMLYAVVAIITGICDIMFYVKLERYTGFAPLVGLTSGILSVMVGATLLMYPTAGHWVMYLLFPMWFIAHCVFRLANLSIVRLIAGRRRCIFTLIVNALGLGFGILLLLHPAVSFFSANLITACYFIVMGVDCMLMGISKVGDP